MNAGRDLGRFDFAASSPENIRVRNGNSARLEMPVDGGFVREDPFFLGAVRHRHDVHIAKFRPPFAPITVREDMMAPDLPPGFHFASLRHRPVEERVEPRHAHAALRRFDVFEEGGEAPDHLALVQVFGDSTKRFEIDSRLGGSLFPRVQPDFIEREFPLQCEKNLPLRRRSVW